MILSLKNSLFLKSIGRDYAEELLDMMRKNSTTQTKAFLFHTRIGENFPPEVCAHQAF